MNTSDITQIDAWLRYDPDTGNLFWRKKPSNRASMRKAAGALTPRGIVIGFDRRLWLAHEIAWFLGHGEWPEAQVIHLNGNRWDNRIENLSQAG